MKVIEYGDIDRYCISVTDISVIYQVPTWEVFGSRDDKVGRTLNGFLLIDKGECFYEWEGGSARLKHGGLIYLGTGSKKVVSVTEKPFSFYRICFTMHEMDTGEQIIFCEKPWMVTESASKNLFHICEEMLDSTLSDKKIFKSTSLLYEFFYILQKHLKPIDSSPISAAREYIEAHYTEKINKAELAEMCFMCESQLFALFKKEIGMPPNKYINHLRMERAKMLLSSGECSNEEVAYMLGYENVYYFSKVFKAYTGTSPSKYKKLQ